MIIEPEEEEEFFANIHLRSLYDAEQHSAVL